MKRTLLSYEMKLTRFFGDSHEFIFSLEIQKEYWWFGKRTKVEKIDYAVSMFQSIKQFKEHWDDMIKNKTLIEK